MYPSFLNKRYVIKVIIIYILERKIPDLKIRGVVSQLACLRWPNVGIGWQRRRRNSNVGPT